MKRQKAGKTGWGGIRAKPTSHAKERSHCSKKHGAGFCVRSPTAGIMKGRTKRKNAI